MDTFTKRSSAVSVGLGWRSQLPIPDGAVTQGDRQQFAYHYAGIAWGEAVQVIYHVYNVAAADESVRSYAAEDGSVRSYAGSAED